MTFLSYFFVILTMHAKHASVIPALFIKTINKREAPLSLSLLFLLSSDGAIVSTEDEVIL